MGAPAFLVVAFRDESSQESVERRRDTEPDCECLGWGFCAASREPAERETKKHEFPATKGSVWPAVASFGGEGG